MAVHKVLVLRQAVGPLDHLNTRGRLPRLTEGPESVSIIRIE
jgi:hypothetical protein